MPTQAASTRQQTQDAVSDSDPEGYDEDDPKGKKRGPNQAARRDQNRIAQREFRLRKQQRIRDLELRVELLSASKDEAFTALDGMLQDLQRENAALRQLVKDLSSFIGEGIGGFLPKLGWDPTSFEEFKNRSETDTISESYQSRKKNPGLPAPVVPLLAGQNSLAGQKRGREESAGAGIGGRKKTKPNEPEQNGYAQPSVYQNNIPQANSSVFTHNQGQNSYLPSAPSSSYSGGNQGAPPIPPPPINTSLPPNVGMYNTTPTSSVQPYSQMGRHSSDPSNSMGSGGMGGNSLGSGVSVTSSQDEGSLQRKDEAARLTHYHLNNYKRNPSYCLPASLRPTHIQRTVAHDFVIDGVPIPELRDKLILMKGKYDLADCVHTLFTTTTIHTDDVLTVGNWEFGEEWFRRFGYLATRSILDTANKWRRERGDPEIPLSLIDGEMEGNGP